MVKPHFHVKWKSKNRFLILERKQAVRPGFSKVLPGRKISVKKPHFVIQWTKQKPPLGGRYGR